MFRNDGHLSKVPCPRLSTCSNSYCPFSHEPVNEEKNEPSLTYREMSAVVDEALAQFCRETGETMIPSQPLSEVEYSPADISATYQNNYSYSNHHDHSVLGANGTTTYDTIHSPEATFSDEEEDTEDDKASQTAYQQHLEMIRRKKKQKVDEKSRKRKPSSEIESIVQDNKGMAALLSKVVDIKCEPNQEPPPPPPVEPMPEKPPPEKIKKTEKVKEKKKRLPSTEAEVVKPKKKPKESKDFNSAKDATSFSKVKRADSRADEAASSLRPSRVPSARKLDPHQALLARAEEMAREQKKPEKKISPFSRERPQEQDLLKPAPRVAHRPTGDSDGSIRLAPVPIGSCPTPVNKRHEVLKILCREARRLYPSNAELPKQVAVEQELKLAKRAKTKATYTSLAAGVVKRLKNAGPGQPSAKEFAPTIDIAKLPPGVGLKRALLDPSIVAKMEKKKEQEKRLKGVHFHRALKPYVLTSEQLKINNYPIPKPENKKHVSINDMGRVKQKITNDPEKRICTRCGKVFQPQVFYVRDGGREVTGGECAYHAGKLYSDRTSHHYSCCGGGAAADPCKYNDTHVHEENKGDHTGYSTTASLQKVQECDKTRVSPGVYGLDCEMVYTTVGFELARVTVVNDLYDIILDKFVRPEGRVLDLNEKYSGVRARDIDPKQNKKCAKSLKDARNMVRAIISEECYILGHSLESDLMALKLAHLKCVDTSVVFPHKRGLPYKRALKTLMQEHCGLVIQQEGEGEGEFGHDSAQDAIACMKLMLWKIEQDIKSGKCDV